MPVIDRDEWINLTKAKVLALDDHREGAKILTEMVRGFGVRDFLNVRTYADAQSAIQEQEFHLIMINVNLKHSDPYEFVSWLRRCEIQPNAFAPVILVAGHTQKKNVERARDCGANVVMAKPATPYAVLTRIMWAARVKRSYVKSGDYVGPDRRFHDTPPAGSPRRRYNDTPSLADDAGEIAS
jgi:CheY-like chemotaxis protein